MVTSARPVEWRNARPATKKAAAVRAGTAAPGTATRCAMPRTDWPGPIPAWTAPPARHGAVAFIQRFGSSRNGHLHFHCVVIDGVSDAAVHSPPTPLRRSMRTTAHGRITRQHVRPALVVSCLRRVSTRSRLSRTRETDAKGPVAGTKSSRRGFDRSASIEILVDAQQIALGVLEPCGLLGTEHAYMIDGPESREIVILEHDSP